VRVGCGDRLPPRGATPFIPRVEPHARPIRPLGQIRLSRLAIAASLPSRQRPRRTKIRWTLNLLEGTTMKKLKLDVEALRVDSFEPATAARARRGTVQGNVFNQDIPHNESEGLACATHGFNYCSSQSSVCPQPFPSYMDETCMCG
jgi:hypothetical protein